MKELKHLKTFEQYTNVDIQNAEIVNEAITVKDIEPLKGNKDGIAKLFKRVFSSALSSFKILGRQLEWELVNKLDNPYKCLIDGANDNFGGTVRLNAEKLLEYTPMKPRFGSDAIGSTAL